MGEGNDEEDVSPFPNDESYQDKKMTKINYDWIKNKDISIRDHEDFVFILHKDIPIDVYTSRVTEEELKSSVSRLERRLKSEK